MSAALPTQGAPKSDGGTVVALGSDSPVREVQHTESGLVVGFSARGLVKFDPARPLVVEHLDFSETLDEHVTSKRGDRALLRFGLRVELWSTRDFRRIAVLLTQPEPGPLQFALSQDGSISTLRTCEERFRVPTTAPTGKAGKSPPVEEDLPCGYVSFDAQGKESGRITSPTKDVNQFDLSPDGKYVVEYGLQLRNLLLRENGKQVLKRVGGRIDGGSRSSDELMEFSGDRLLLSRFGLVEYDDLATGKVISSQRYAVESPDEPIMHVRLTQAPIVASLWPSKARLFLYSFEKTGPAKAVSLNKVFSEGCMGCSMEPDGDGVLISNNERTVHVNRAGIVTERPASKVSATLAAGASGRVVESYDDRGQRCSWVPTGVDVNSALELPRSMCLSVSLGKDVLAANPSGGLHVWDLKDQKLTLEYGGNMADVHGTLFVDNEVAGFLGRDGKPLWLTHEAPPKTPVAEDAKHFNRAARTQTHVFTLERTEKSTWIVARDKDDKEVMREDLGGQVASVYLHASGPRIAVPRWSSRGAEAVICEVGKGCSAMLDSGAPFGLLDHWLLWRTGKRVEIVDLRTRDPVVLPEDQCTVPVGVGKVAGAPRFVCMHHLRVKGETETTLRSFDTTGKQVTTLKIEDGQSRMSMPTKKPTKGGWGDLWFEQSGVRWIRGKMLVPALRRGSTALFDLERGRLADVYADGAGAVVTFPDGSFERFGTSNGDARFRCRRGALSYPLSTCDAREVTGRWSAVLQGP